MAVYGAKIALLGGVIDYAGTFPPAALPLEQALATGAAFRRTGKHPWLLSKVALPLQEIKKLNAARLFDAGSDGSAWLYTALGSPVASDSDFSRTVEWDLRELVRCNRRGMEASLRQWIVSYETRPPEEDWEGAGLGGLARRWEPLLTHFSEKLGRGFTLFFEVPWDGDWATHLEAAAGALAHWQGEQDSEMLGLGLKFRTGGKYVPTAEQLAAAITTCTRYGLRFKATQGLHHAMSREGEWGFVNLFAALAFSRSLGDEQFGQDRVARCLRETRPEAFRFEGDRFHWDGLTLESAQIEEARRSHGATFGSCSLDEPDEDLAEVFGSGK